MLEPISTATALLSLAGAVGNTLLLFNNIRTSYRDAPKKFTLLYLQFQLFHRLLERLQMLLQLISIDEDCAEYVIALKGATDIHTDLAHHLRKLDAPTNGNSLNWSRKARLVFDQETLNEYIAQIGWFRDHFAFLLQLYDRTIDLQSASNPSIGTRLPKHSAFLRLSQCPPWTVITRS